MKKNIYRSRNYRDFYSKTRERLNRNNNYIKSNNGIEELKDSAYWRKWLDPVVIVTIILAIATFALYLEATRQSKISEQSATEAKRASEAAIKADSLTEISFKRDSVRYQLSSKNDSVRNARNLMLAVSSVDAQIMSLKKSQTFFDIENQPYLQITHPKLELFASEKPLKITFTIENIGKYPVQILEYKSATLACTELPTTKEVITGGENPIKYANTYISKEHPLEAEIGDTILLSNDVYQRAKTQKFNMYLIGYIRYKNIGTGKHRIYKYRIVMECKTGAWGQFIFSDNRDISPKEEKEQSLVN